MKLYGVVVDAECNKFEQHVDLFDQAYWTWHLIWQYICLPFCILGRTKDAFSWFSIDLLIFVYTFHFPQDVHTAHCTCQLIDTHLLSVILNWICTFDRLSNFSDVFLNFLEESGAKGDRKPKPTRNKYEWNVLNRSGGEKDKVYDESKIHYDIRNTL